VALLAAAAALAAPAVASAHPLGNFTTNRYAEVVASGDRAYVRYVLDLAEIPTVQARPTVERLGRDAYAAELSGRIARDVSLTVDGERRPLRMLGRSLRFLPGAAGLRTTRLEIVYDAGAVEPSRPVRIGYADSGFAGRLGWTEVVVRATRGATLTASTAPRTSVSGALRRYPRSLLRSPLDVTRATASVSAGSVEGAPPRIDGRAVAIPDRGAGVSETGFASLIQKDDLSPGLIFVSLVLALFWGAAHALTPGHGKAIVAAYMVGTRGSARHAFLLGGIVTVTHTIGVFALGLVTLALSEFVVPEQLYPWLNLVSALLVVGVGLAVLRARGAGWLRGRHGHAHGHTHHDHHHHHHHHGHHHQHEHEDGHGHSHIPPTGSGLRGLVAVGISGGILPCPTALVVLLAAISLHRVGYGLLLIVAFSVGLAGVVTAIGLLAVGSRRLFDRVDLDRGLVRALPAVSAVVIVLLGVAMTVRALPTVS
jgi:ABC-type nickel/cobalt efflux system permease component RcnA